MNFLEIEDQTIKRLSRHMTVAEGKSDYSYHGPRKNMRKTIEQHIAAKRIVDSPELTAAMAEVRKAESRIRKLKLSGLSSIEVRNFEKSVFSELIKAVESRKHKRIMTLANEIDARRKKENTENPTARLLKLEEAKLQYSKLGEKNALTRIAGFERSGYSREDLLVLGSISNRTYERAQQVREMLPEYLADEEGVSMLKELEHLVNTKIGHVDYHFSGSSVVSSIHIADLLSEVEPSLHDVAV